MNSYNEKNILVVGGARSGISTIKTLKKLGAKVFLNDIKTQEELGEIVGEMKAYVDVFILGRHPEDLRRFDQVILSPGVPTHLDFIVEARKMGIEVIGELEFAFRITRGKFVAITGTNGKTTTTSLVGEIFEKSKHKSFVVGNIGIPVASKALEAHEDTYMVTEVSSFQLETISKFHSIVSAVLNITPDHLNRHKTMENYIDIKANVFLNSRDEDFVVLNYDNIEARNLAQRAKCKVVYFSRKEKLDNGVVFDGEGIFLVNDNNRTFVCSKEDIFIKGSHNIENVMAAVAISYLAGVEIEVISESIKEFKGVEHRIEFVREINDIKFYNDSKGTNPDASIKAVEAMDRPTILIAGGMDKGSDFGEFLNSFNDIIKHMVILGETKDKLANCAEEKGFKNYTLVSNMIEAVKVSCSLAEPGYNVLLSPACASWDMYESYEHRGDEFKELVSNLDFVNGVGYEK